jgi:peptidoglycan/LPS O-acetylase OafA/YrhL
MNLPVIQVAVGVCIALAIALAYAVFRYMTQPPEAIGRRSPAPSTGRDELQDWSTPSPKVSSTRKAGRP